MDNVLVDFLSGMESRSAETLKEYEGRIDEIPGIFSQMRPMPGAIEAMHRLQDKYDLYILSTAPWLNASAWADKLLWVRERLNDVFYKRIILSHHKDLLKGDYLIDDSSKNGADRFEGERIVFGSAKFPDWESVTNYLLS